ncbi:hypothetical protein [Chryseobacterium rhizosphaerae]|nr:hypothetical protein [Chryseobacterium rhizosphaerae]
MVSRNVGVKIPGAIAFCLAVLGYFFYKDNLRKESKSMEEKNVTISFSGKIDSMYRDYSNHGVTVLILNNKKRLEFNMYEYSRFQKNDSIVKCKDEDRIHVYRNGTIKSYKY